MNLFVGNISRNISESDLKKEFGRFGECRVEKRVIFFLVFVLSKTNIRVAMVSLSTLRKLMLKKPKKSFRDITLVD